MAKPPNIGSCWSQQPADSFLICLEIIIFAVSPGILFVFHFAAYGERIQWAYDLWNVEIEFSVMIRFGNMRRRHWSHKAKCNSMTQLMKWNKCHRKHRRREEDENEFVLTYSTWNVRRYSCCPTTTLMNSTNFMRMWAHDSFFTFGTQHLGRLTFQRLGIQRL